MTYPQFDRGSNNSPLDDEELQAFDELLQGVPADGAMTIEGDLQPLMANLQVIKDMLALPRRIGQGR